MFKRAWRSIRNNILVGLILIIPIVITGFIINWLFNFATNRLITFIPKELFGMYPTLFFRAAALITVLIILYLLGLLFRNIVGRRLYWIGDRIFTRIPLVNKVYLFVRNTSEALLDQSQTMFKEVVVVEYPRPGVFSMGFVTGTTPKRLQTLIPGAKQDEPLVSVFIPTTPNPTSGWFALLPRSCVYPIPITIGDAMKLIISGGAVFPGEVDLLDRPTLLDKLEQWIAKQSKTESPK